MLALRNTVPDVLFIDPINHQWEPNLCFARLPYGRQLHGSEVWQQNDHTVAQVLETTS